MISGLEKNGLLLQSLLTGSTSVCFLDFSVASSSGLCDGSSSVVQRGLLGSVGFSRFCKDLCLLSCDKKVIVTLEGKEP